MGSRRGSTDGCNGLRAGPVADVGVDGYEVWAGGNGFAKDCGEDVEEGVDCEGAGVGIASGLVVRLTVDGAGEAVLRWCRVLLVILENPTRCSSSHASSTDSVEIQKWLNQAEQSRVLK